ncbi:hypothetical protein [Nesterenkonia populi]
MKEINLATSLAVVATLLNVVALAGYLMMDSVPVWQTTLFALSALGMVAVALMLAKTRKQRRHG